MNVKIVITISTTYDRLLSISPELFPKSSSIGYVISCQGAREKPSQIYKEAGERIFGGNAEVFLLEGYGLSRNRNNAISNALKLESDYIYVADDDIEIKESSLLAAAVECLNSSIDIGIAKVGQIGSSELFKNYRNRDARSKFGLAFSASSVELLIRTNFLKKNQIEFDERFGLGSIYPSGEEFIFILDSIRAGATVKAVDVVVCDHEAISSGKDFYSDEKLIVAKGAMMKRGTKSIVVSLILGVLFSLKKHREYKQTIGFFKFCFNLSKGILKIGH